MRMKKLLLFTIFTITAFFGIAQKKVVNPKKFVATIKAADLKEKLTILASAEMEGRETATEGQKKAAAYIEEQFKKNGLLPGYDNSYYQRFNVYQDVLNSSSFSVFDMQLQNPYAYSLSLNNAVNGNWSINEVAFVSFAETTKDKDDFKDIDVSGKWVMLIDFNAADIDKGDDYFVNSRGALAAKVKMATQKGALGVMAISKMFQQKNNTNAATRGSMYMKRNSTEKNIPVVYISYQTAASVLTKNISSFTDLKSIENSVYKTNVKLNIDKTTNTLESSNVLGVLEGSDKKDEYVFLTAHYDHLGKRDSVIYYGADDDGSGTVSIIEMAEAFGEAKKKGFTPRRTIVFMAVSGEEKGLWGSAYYAENPAYPLNKTSVDLNTDMVGRIDPTYKGDSMNYVYVIGEDKLSSDLLKISDSINKTFKLELDRRFNDPNDVNRFYYRSDHYNFAKKGVPVIFYFNGTHKDYHKPSDTVEKINFDLMAKRVKFIFSTAWAIANKDEMLKRDLPLNMPERR